MTITVIGTVFVDIKGYANAKINAECKNVGDIEFASGGVGRNVAEAIARAGGSVEFISSVDTSSQGEAVLAGLASVGIGADRVVRTERGMGMWLAVLDHDGDLAASISQKPNLAPLEHLLETQGEEIVKNTDAIVIEFDLAESVVNKIFGWAKQYGKPVYGIVGNLEVLMQRKSMINNLNLFICNKAEAEEFLGVTLTSPEECKMAAREMTEAGLQTAVITMGEHGSVFYDRIYNEFGFVPCECVKVVDTTGAGDSFFSGTVYGLVNGFGLGRSVECGTKLAAWTISSKANVDPEIQEKVRHDPLFQRVTVLN
ncbi:carbohydrate kinase family protein [Tumebacillus permanentifrigoris]|uniref:Pseudouridine kinase n=1 Tax=Tumebacillus permanentifrigoris TaxID=378543 RepID=A0A316DVI7_9BACL|nr:carbohydrate kinase family protein [Tumebacillus permanentifrigoris]PWK13355.1 pseudouridine kinase [Tumebacillus permanentifrigoris]